jgi:trimethylamine--corrinoid protein Co-methyltransferase
MVDFEKHTLPSFRVFTKDALEAIHLASLEVLEKTGIKIVHGESILKMLKENGCIVDFKRGLVKFPLYIVEEAVKKTPKTHPSYGRNPKYGYKLDACSCSEVFT